MKDYLRDKFFLSLWIIFFMLLGWAMAPIWQWLFFENYLGPSL